MKKYFLLFSSVSVMLALTACETMNSRSSASNQFASSNQDIIELQNDVAALKAQMNNVSSRNNAVLQKLSSLQSQVNYVNDQNQQQVKTIEALRQSIEQERAARQAAMNKVVETVADQTAKTVNSIARQQQYHSQAVSSGSSVPAGAYYKHTVASGETLSAIARAYKVSIKDIRDANRIKGDIIIVGQVLHIPKK
jgi:LysM repeat protein